MKELLNSGAYVDITIAPVKLGYSLLQAVIREFKRDGIKFEISADDDILNIGGLFKKDPAKFFDNLLNVVTSDNVVDVIFQCAKSCIYEKNGVKQKIDWELFDDENNRADFFEVMFIIAKKNLSPFFPKARTQSKQTTE